MAPDSPNTRRVEGILDDLWRTTSAPGTMMVLLGLLAATLAMAAVFPQRPGNLTNAAAVRWMAATAGSYPRLGSLLRALGTFSILDSPWLRILLAALAFSLALRLAEEVHRLILLKRTFRAISRDFGHDASACPSPVSVLRRGTPDASRRHVVAMVGPSLAYLGALLLLAGLLTNSAAGWRASDIALAPGSKIAVSQTAGLVISLEHITGNEPDAESSIVLAQTGETPQASPLTSPPSPAESPLGLGHAGQGPESALSLPKGRTRLARITYWRPARWGNIWIAQRAIGPVLQVTAKDIRNRPLILQTLEQGGDVEHPLQRVGQGVQLLFGQTQAEQALAIPTRNLAFRVVSYPALPERGINGPVFLVEAYRGDDPTPVLSELVGDEVTLPVEDVTLHLAPDRHTVLEVAYLPGMLALLLGGLLVLAGVILALGRRGNYSGYVRPEQADAN